MVFNNFNIKSIKVLIISFFLSFFLCLSYSYAGDLMKDLFKPAMKEQVMYEYNDKNEVGRRLFGGETSLSISTSGVSIKQRPPILVIFTRLLLCLVVAISVTMILYNGMQYIITTSQGKDATKDLVWNLVYTVIGILLAIGSVTIITIIQSIPNTAYNEMMKTNNEMMKTKHSQILENVISK